MYRLKIFFLSGIFWCFSAVILSSCGDFSGAVRTDSAADSTDTKAVKGEFVPDMDKLNREYLVLSTDTTEQQIMLRDIENNRQLLYSYSLHTEFNDKYGGYISITAFTPGRVCKILGLDERGGINKLCLSDEVWELENIKSYSIDQERGVFTVGVTNYRIEESTPVFSDTAITDIGSIGTNDVLRIVGKDKDIWGITVTSGHGHLNLVNTNVFNGSLVAIGDIYTIISGDMTIEVPEGTYDITLANNGYGGEAEVVIPRGEQVTLDLDAIKTQNIQYCKLIFNIEAANAVIKIDGNQVNKDEVLDVIYGRHTLSVSAPGYESWSKYLFVNSPTATIMLTMEQEGKAKSNNNTKPQTPNTSPQTKPDTGTEDNSKKTEQDKKKQTELEYLTTIRDTISSIMKNID